MVSRHHIPATDSGIRSYFGFAAIAGILAVILALVRSRRTGLEVALVALALALLGLRDLTTRSRRVLTVGAWFALLAVAAIAVEPHVH